MKFSEIHLLKNALSLYKYSEHLNLGSLKKRKRPRIFNISNIFIRICIYPYFPRSDKFRTGSVHGSRYCLYVTRVRRAFHVLVVNADHGISCGLSVFTGPTALRMFARNTEALSPGPCRPTYPAFVHAASVQSSRGNCTVHVCACGVHA